MSTIELVHEIKRLSNSERLEIIEAATFLIREDLLAQAGQRRAATTNRLRAAALQAQAHYVPDGEMSEWTVLDGEEVLDDPVGDTNHAIQG